MTLLEETSMQTTKMMLRAAFAALLAMPTVAVGAQEELSCGTRVHP